MDRNEPLMTAWGRDIDEKAVLTEYPRPQFQRDSCLILNGRWEYGIAKNKEPFHLDGAILVPFSPESALSGVRRAVHPHEWLFYKRKVVLPPNFNQGRLLLHFGAVDQEAEVFIDDEYVGGHIGGFTPFSFDITEFVSGSSFIIQVRVKDHSDTFHHQVGKQKLRPKGIFYTAQSGIWQTVWMESVSETHLASMRITPRFDEGAFAFSFDKRGEGLIKVTARFAGNIVGEATTSDDSLLLQVNERHEWTPEHPHLYDFQILFGEDEISSYGALRSFASKEGNDGLKRFHLNGEPYLLLSVLDQGYWPDGLLTSPSDQAFVYDIQLVKSMGFNSIRKHIKIEPLRFYYHCDRLGVIVIQDMVNGGRARSIVPNGIFSMLGIYVNDKHYGWFGREEAASRNQFRMELDEMINHLYNVPSIAIWVPFNEAWGQFDATEIAKSIASQDKSRLIDHASGWADQGAGDFYSRHIYFSKVRFRKHTGKIRINALTEFGGYALKIKDHQYDEKRSFGYRLCDDEQSFYRALENLWIDELAPQMKQGLSLIVYTQLSDVETEINGLVTYDRAVIKINVESLQALNETLQAAFKEAI